MPIVFMMLRHSFRRPCNPSGWGAMLMELVDGVIVPGGTI